MSMGLHVRLREGGFSSKHIIITTRLVIYKVTSFSKLWWNNGKNLKWVIWNSESNCKLMSLQAIYWVLYNG